MSNRQTVELAVVDACPELSQAQVTLVVDTLVPLVTGFLSAKVQAEADEVSATAEFAEAYGAAHEIDAVVVPVEDVHELNGGVVRAYYQVAQKVHGWGRELLS